MSASKDYQKATTEDLSSTPVLQHFPSFQSSMAGGNTVTNKLDVDGLNSGQGSPSEATSDVVAKNVQYVGYSHDPPVLPGPETSASDLGTDEKGTGYSPAAPAWKEL
jgi:hypothetical protein